ncbi:response regulator transcription factor [Tistlia consotensis]|nr:response regulator transcription factor [Tistlia consotensis]
MTESPLIRILLIDDDDLFRRSLARSLADQDFQVTECNDGQIGLDLLRHDRSFDLIFLDWGMSDRSGLEVMCEIKAVGIGIPVVFLTDRASERNEAIALDNGAADFLDKSRSAAVLARRIRILVGSRRGPRGEAAEVLRVGPLEIQSRKSRAYWNGTPVPLTATEFRVVQLLASRAGEDVAYRAIYDVVHGRGFIAGDGAQGYRTNVRSMIKRIRQKFRELDEGFEAIENYPGVGYLWREEPPKAGPAADGAAAPVDVLDKLSRLPFVRSVASWRRRQDQASDGLLRLAPASGTGGGVPRPAQDAEAVETGAPSEPLRATARSQPERG